MLSIFFPAHDDLSYRGAGFLSSSMFVPVLDSAPVPCPVCSRSLLEERINSVIQRASNSKEVRPASREALRSVIIAGRYKDPGNSSESVL